MDGYEPHSHIYSWDTPAGAVAADMVTSGWVGRGVPGVVLGGWSWRGTTRVLPSTLQDPIFNIFLRLSPTHGPKKAILSVL